MARRCELTGKGVLTGNNVSHANNKSRRRYLPNLNNVTFESEKLGRRFTFKVSTRAIRTVDKVGGLDMYLAKAKDDLLSDAARKVKKAIATA